MSTSPGSTSCRSRVCCGYDPCATPSTYEDRAAAPIQTWLDRLIPSLERRKHRRRGHSIRAWQMYDTPGWTCSCGREWVG